MKRIFIKKREYIIYRNKGCRYTMKCLNCDKYFEINSSKFNDNGGKVCSKKCHIEFLAKTHKGKNHWYWKGGLPKCLTCNKELSRYDAKYCSQHSIKFQKGKGNINWKGGLNYNITRRAMKLNAEGSHTLKEWLILKIKYQFMCLCCKKTEPEIKLTEDHIIPLSKGGSNYIENIQPLCGSCNSIKHDKIINFLSNDRKSESDEF